MSIGFNGQFNVLFKLTFKTTGYATFEALEEYTTGHYMRVE
jgi:hypothetical protein